MHTPGPWEVDDPNSHFVAKKVNGTYEYIADTSPRHWPTTERSAQEIDDNARLIAAAPELLTALRALMEGSEYRSIDLGGGSMPAQWVKIVCPSPEAMEVARAAMAKATGNRP